MGFVVKGILAAFWLLLVPTVSGSVILQKKQSRTPGECFLAGYAFLFALFELLTLPMMYLKLPLHILAGTYAVLLLLVLVYGCVRLLKGWRGWIRRGFSGVSLYFWIAAAVIFVQILTVVFFASMDADDSFFVGVATTSLHTDTIFSIDPHTGAAYRTLPSRYVLSPFPVFLAVVSWLCASLHPAIMAHIIFPAVFLPMGYVAVYQVGRKWFQDDKRATGIFLFFCSVLNCFTAYSIYNVGNFHMVRIWQGKALLAAALLPVVFLLSYDALLEEKPEYPLYLSIAANMGCCLISSMGIMLAPLVTGILAVLGAIRQKSVIPLGKCLLCCAPSLVLGITYILIR